MRASHWFLEGCTRSDPGQWERGICTTYESQLSPAAVGPEVSGVLPACVTQTVTYASRKS